MGNDEEDEKALQKAVASLDKLVGRLEATTKTNARDSTNAINSLSAHIIDLKRSLEERGKTEYRTINWLIDAVDKQTNAINANVGAMQSGDEMVEKAIRELGTRVDSLKESIEEKQEEFYITYPASDGVQTITYEATNPRLEIDFYTGTVKMPDGTKYQYPKTSATSEPLKNYEERIGQKIGWLRSLEIYADHDVVFSFDEKAANTMCYGGHTRVLWHQEFKKVIIEVKETTESTNLSISVSTNPKGVRRLETCGPRARDITTIEWANVIQNTTDNTPDTDTEIDIAHTRSIAIQVDTTATANTSADIDINVETSPEGITWDTVLYTTYNIGDNEIKTFLVEPGPRRMRLRLDENNSGAGSVTCRVFLREA